MLNHKKIIVANWKMHKVALDASNFMQNFTETSLKNEVVICPPFTLIMSLNQSKDISLAAQDLSANAPVSGAFTGEISANMLKSLGCKYVLVGHSERRKYHQENEPLLKKKILNAFLEGLVPIICLGENIEQREKGDYLNYLENSLNSCLPNEAKDNEFIIAYEPVWSIGTGKTASLKEIEEVHNFLSQILITRFAKKTKILYGGSVNLNNAHEIIRADKVSGLLIGGASLDPNIFKQIVLSTEG